jgi:hypothetical protein
VQTISATLTSNVCCLFRLCALQPFRAINTRAFRRAVDEYSNCRLDMRLGVQQLDDLTCPACSEGGAAYHIDSNMKLFVWDRNREPWREQHFREFFAADADVQLTLKATDAARMSSGVCCTGQMEAVTQYTVCPCCRNGYSLRHAPLATRFMLLYHC